MSSGIQLQQFNKFWFSRLYQEKDKQHFILDPFTCVVRLAVLGFMNNGTKISIFDNRISYCTPTFLQGPLRWTFGDKRDDLHNLYLPIRKFIKWYNFQNNEIREIVRLAMNGLMRLTECYEPHTIISHSLELYSNSLLHAYEKNVPSSIINSESQFSTESHVEEEYEETEEIEKRENIEGGIVKTNNQPIFYQNVSIEDEAEMNIIYQKFQELYSNREINIIYSLLLEIEIETKTLDESDINSNDKRESLLQAIDSILTTKEKNVYDIIKNTSTLLE